VYAGCRHSFLVNPGEIDPWWLSILAILPALLATILVFLDQQITAVIVNRKEHKLKASHTQLKRMTHAPETAATLASIYGKSFMQIWYQLCPL